MLKNNNQEVLRRLSRRLLKMNRMRNIFAVLAIILTTFMFTTIFSIGISLIHNLSVMQMRRVGSQSCIWLENPSEKQIEDVKKMQDLRAAGVQTNAGNRMDGTGKKTVTLWYYDTTEYTKNYCPSISDIHGTYPLEENEIMLSETSLAVLGIKRPKIGQRVDLYNKKAGEVFVLSGWYRDYIYDKAVGLVSSKYIRKMGLDKRENKTLSVSARTGMKQILYENMKNQISLDRIASGDGIRRNQYWSASFNDDLNSAGEKMIIIITIVGIGMIIVLSGYLLIYNVMYISVTKDIRFYGLLKTIGTTPVQLQKIVKCQIWKLAGLGIPLGLLFGTGAAFGIVPAALYTLTAGENDSMPREVQFHPAIYIVTIVFSFATIWLSCRKPAHIAGSISAVEAAKYNGKRQEKIRYHRSAKGGRIRKMAYRNVFREKKRALLVFSSLFMGTMSFLAVDTFLGSIKLENYLKYYLVNDYVIYTGTNDSNEQSRDQKRSIQTLAEDIQKIPGITYFRWNRTAQIVLPFDEKLYQPFLDAGSRTAAEKEEYIKYYKRAREIKDMYSCPVISVGMKEIYRYNKRVSKDQRIDPEAFKEGKICIIGTVHTKEQAEQMKGKVLTLQDVKSHKKSKIRVGVCVRTMGGFEIGNYWLSQGAPEAVLVSDKAVERITDSPGSDNLIINCSKKAEPSVTAQIKELTAANTNVVNTLIKSEAAKQFSTAIIIYRILGGGVSGILLLIGLLNYINVMLTGVFTRRMEFAVLESVGMTKKQICRMLLWEGGCYGMISIGLILTVGNLIIFRIAKTAELVVDYAVFHYPAGVFGIMSGGILVVCMVVPAVVYYMISKESITERMHREE